MANLLVGIVLCGLLGLTGQAVRAIVGLSSAQVLGASPNQQSAFNAAYLLVSLVIGFVAGVLAGFALHMISPDPGTPPGAETLLGLMAAGYAGTDFIENTFMTLMPKISPPAHNPAPHVAGQDNPSASASIDTASVTSTMKSLTETIKVFNTNIANTSAQTSVSASVATTQTALPVDLRATIPKILPRLDAAKWLPLLEEVLPIFEINTPLRIAAAFGQFTQEAGESFADLREHMNYTAAELLDLFKNEVPDQATANRLAQQGGEAIGNVVYAHKNGNGDAASGDGFRFRGGGLCQLTGRHNYQQFAQAIGMSVEDAAAYVGTAEGAIISGCWYLSAHGCLPLADRWQLTPLTKIVNGDGLAGLAARIDYSNRFRLAFGAALPAAAAAH